MTNQSTNGDELPEGWLNGQVGTIFQFSGGGTPNRSEPRFWGGTIPWLSSGDIKSDRISTGSEFITDEGLASRSARLSPAGAIVVVVRSGILKHTLPVAVLEQPAAINQDIRCLDSGNADLNEWLALALRAFSQQILEQNREGTTVQSVKTETLRAFQLPIPPLAEQKRIVAKVETLLARVNAARQRLAKVPALLKRFRQSVLAAACSGQLTEDWRVQHSEADDAVKIVANLEKSHEAAGGHKQGNAAQPTHEAHDLSEESLPSSWRMTEFRTAVLPDRPITYGILKPGPDTPGGVHYVRVADFPNDRLKLNDRA